MNYGFLKPKLAPAITLFFIFVFYVLFSYLPIARKLEISYRDYFSNLLIGMCLGSVSLFPTIVGLSKSILKRPFVFTPTSKNRKQSSPFSQFKTLFPIYILCLIGVLGLVRNPVLLVFNWTWIFPLIIAPFIFFEFKA